MTERQMHVTPVFKIIEDNLDLTTILLTKQQRNETTIGKPCPIKCDSKQFVELCDNVADTIRTKCF